MSLIFADSFDTYTDLHSAYSIVLGTIVTGGQARTGPGCVAIISGAFGPGKFHRRTSDLLVASAWLSSMQAEALWLLDSTSFAGGNGQVLRAVVNIDGSVSVQTRTNGPTIATSAPGVVNFNVYNSIALRGTNAGGVTWYARVYVNGILVLTTPVVDPLTGTSQLNGFELMGPGGSGGIAYHDDVYVLDCSDAVNNDYLGALRCYASVPDADGTVQWTPSVGATNFSNVNQIPPDQNTIYNSSSTIGQIDQYRHPLNPQVPANARIFAVQHRMDLEVDSGARSVTDDVGGVQSPNAVALASGYVIDPWPYDDNPITTAPWQQADFPLLAGPAVTA